MSETSDKTPRVTLRDAADRTGIPLDALRKRVYRGSLPAEKIDGHYTILEADLDTIGSLGQSSTAETSGETVRGHGSDMGETASSAIAADYIASLKGEIGFLREELTARTNDLQAAHVIISQLTQRLPQLATGSESPQDREVAPHGDNPPVEGQQSSRRRWWRWW